MTKSIAHLCCYVLLLAFVADADNQQRTDNAISDDETFLTAEDLKIGEILASKPMAVPSADSKALYSNSLFEGDIVNPYVEAGALGNATSMGSLYGNALRDLRLRWKGGIVPFVISKSYTADQRAVIAAAIADYHNYTCIQFRDKREEDKNYISIKPLGGCYSQVGSTGGMQELSLGDGCVYKGVVIHEMMHALGFFHEQSRTKRDKYVEILFDNIHDGMAYNFDSYEASEVSALNITYDYNSIMHYGSHGFSKNGEPTIQPRDRTKIIGQREGLSRRDAIKIKKYYECKGDYARTPKITHCNDEYGNCEANRKFCSNEGIKKGCRKTCNVC